MKKCILFFLSLVSLTYASDKAPYCQDPERESEVNKKMESAYEHFMHGGVEVGLGVMLFPGQPVGSSIIIMDGVRRMKDGYVEYRDAYEIIQEDRASFEMQDRGMEPCGPDLSDRN